MKTLVTGGLGYIGSHTCLALLSEGHDVVILDNLSNSSKTVLDRIEKIAGQRPVFVEGDIRDKNALIEIFRKNEISRVIHFAALKAVAESVADPLLYYDNNVAGTIVLLSAMKASGTKTLVFSSSATVYGAPSSSPIREDFPKNAINPYGASKIVIEDLLMHLAASDPEWRIAMLRYFNPIGAHESGLIGEEPRGIPNNLMPYLLQVVCGQRPELNIFGNDYPTRDGTCVRDFIHVQDVAEGHLAALKYLQNKTGVLTANLGTGQGVSVLELCHAVEEAAGRNVPRRFVGRREGDAPECWSDPNFARETMGWVARRSLRSMCEDSLRWARNNIQA